jgi:threonine 3-dehydrogenase
MSAIEATLPSGLDISAVIAHRFTHFEFEEAFAVARSGMIGQGIRDWIV